jgi:hypothetical protein
MLLYRLFLEKELTSFSFYIILFRGIDKFFILYYSIYKNFFVS